MEASGLTKKTFFVSSPQLAVIKIFPTPRRRLADRLPVLVKVWGNACVQVPAALGVVVRRTRIARWERRDSFQTARHILLIEPIDKLPVLACLVVFAQHTCVVIWTWTIVIVRNRTRRRDRRMVAALVVGVGQVSVVVGVVRRRRVGPRRNRPRWMRMWIVFTEARFDARSQARHAPELFVLVPVYYCLQKNEKRHHLIFCSLCFLSCHWVTTESEMPKHTVSVELSELKLTLKRLRKVINTLKSQAVDRGFPDSVVALLTLSVPPQPPYKVPEDEQHVIIANMIARAVEDVRNIDNVFSRASNGRFVPIRAGSADPEVDTVRRMVDNIVDSVSFCLSVTPGDVPTFASVADLANWFHERISRHSRSPPQKVSLPKLPVAEIPRPEQFTVYSLGLQPTNADAHHHAIHPPVRKRGRPRKNPVVVKTTPEQKRPTEAIADGTLLQYKVPATEHVVRVLVGKVPNEVAMRFYKRPPHPRQFQRMGWKAAHEHFQLGNVRGRNPVPGSMWYKRTARTKWTDWARNWWPKNAVEAAVRIQELHTMVPDVRDWGPEEVQLERWYNAYNLDNMTRIPGIKVRRTNEELRHDLQQQAEPVEPDHLNRALIEIAQDMAEWSDDMFIDNDEQPKRRRVQNNWPPFCKYDDTRRLPCSLTSESSQSDTERCRYNASQNRRASRCTLSDAEKQRRRKNRPFWCKRSLHRPERCIQTSKTHNDGTACRPDLTSRRCVVVS